MNATHYPAHSLKPGDIIAVFKGKEVFDGPRPALMGGYYIPLTDGSRYFVKTLEQLVPVR